jgi:signal transduction histidine kinase
VYLIVSEALKNAFRHAKARNIRISLHFRSGEFQLTIADDGIGIEKNVQERGRDGHFGLRGMRERAERHSGVLTIKSAEGSGTELSLLLLAREAYQRSST